MATDFVWFHGDDHYDDTYGRYCCNVQLWPWLSVITGYFYGIIHSINGVLLVLITGISGHNCNLVKHILVLLYIYLVLRGLLF